MEESRNILVPVDGSEGSARAAAFAAGLARDTGARVALLHVYDAPTAVAMGLMAAVPTDLDDSYATLTQACFAKAKAAMGEVEVKEHLVEIGHPAERIVEVASTGGFSQIVMGSRGLSPFKELLLGSVSERVLRNAHCAVTIVR
ncbi:MAG: universal stress protein [Candidatus Binatia bacterium]